MTRPLTALAWLAFSALTLSACGAQHVNPSPSLSPAQLLQKDLGDIFSSPQFSRSTWSVLVRPASSGTDLYALNSSKLVMPGSNMKILTLAAASDRLGWNYRFETKIVATAPVESGILRGDLFIVGSGDPSISERGDERGALRTLAQQVRDSGIREIEGRIIGDDDALDDQQLGDGWPWDNLAYGYSAPVTALEYNEGSVDLMIRAGNAAGDLVDVQVRPDGSGLEIDNRLVTVADTGMGMLTLDRLPGSPHLIIRGQIPARAAPFVRTASVDNPTQFFAAAFLAALKSAGVQVDKGPLDLDYVLPKPDVSQARTIAARRSAPLSQIATSMMKNSQNQYAELLFKMVGGKQAETDRLRGMGIPDDSYIIADGSGLSRYNYVTDEAIVKILQMFQPRATNPTPFASTLPIAGRDGTLARRLLGTPAEAKVRAKSGTIDNVRALSGFVEDADGETLVFSIVANNFSLPIATIDAAIDKALIRLATFKRQ